MLTVRIGAGANVLPVKRALCGSYMQRRPSFIPWWTGSQEHSHIVGSLKSLNTWAERETDVKSSSTNTETWCLTHQDDKRSLYRFHTKKKSKEISNNKEAIMRWAPETHSECWHSCWWTAHRNWSHYEVFLADIGDGQLFCVHSRIVLD